MFNRYTCRIVAQYKNLVLKYVHLSPLFANWTFQPITPYLPSGLYKPVHIWHFLSTQMQSYQSIFVYIFARKTSILQMCIFYLHVFSPKKTRILEQKHGKKLGWHSPYRFYYSKHWTIVKKISSFNISNCKKIIFLIAPTKTIHIIHSVPPSIYYYKRIVMATGNWPTLVDEYSS